MKSISLKTKIITGLITGGMLLSSVSLAFGTTANPLNTDGRATLKNEFRQPKGNLEATLKVAVSSNIITQAESDKILAYENSKVKTKDKKEKNTTEKPDLFKELVTNNILTQAKADALKVSEQTQRDTQWQLNLDTNLSKLVTDKTITEAEADKIKVAIIAEEAANKSERAKTESMTESQRKTYMDNNKVDHISPLKALVDNGTITQAQAEKVGTCGIGGPGKFNWKAMKPKGNLEDLVTDKTITQDQADKIKAAMIKEEAAKVVERAKTESMTEAERKTYMDNNKADHISPLKTLVDNGTITQTQADKIGPGAGNHMSGLKMK